MIMVGSVCREVAVAVVVTAASGYELGYVWRSCGKTGERTAGGYYLNASLQGEAPGRWFGRGAQALGLDGEVQRLAYDDVYCQRDPQTGARLGRAPGRYVTFEQHRDRLLAAEPHATTERRLELEREAHQLAREPAPLKGVSLGLVFRNLRPRRRGSSLSSFRATAASSLTRPA
jgi:TrwC relaxase